MERQFSFKRKEKRFLFIVGVVVYMIALHISYVQFISPAFAYMKFTYQPVSLAHMFVSWIIVVAPSFWMPVSFGRPSHFVYWLLYICVVIPIGMVPMYVASENLDQVLIFVFSVTLSHSVLALIYKVPLLHITRTKARNFQVIAGLLTLTVVVFALIVHTYGLQTRWVSLWDVYDVRADHTSKTTRWMAYLVSWQANVVNILLMAYGLVKKKWMLLLLGVFGQLYLYTTAAYKSILYSVVLVVAILLLTKVRWRNMAVTMVWVALAVIVTACAVDIMTESILASALITRRIFVVPGLLGWFYFDFFSHNPKLMLSHSVLSPLVSYPYTYTPASTIGLHYFGSSEASANAGVWADAFANFGYIGIIIFTFALGMVMWIYDSLANRVDWRLAVVMLGVPAFTLTNSSLLTTLLTHGLGVVMIALYFVPATPREAKG